MAPDIGLEITAMPFRNQSVAQASRLCRHGKACGYHELPFDCNNESPANFSGMIVGQLAQFTNVEFHSKVLFSGLTVGGKLIANVIFNATEDPKGAKFKGVVFGNSEARVERIT